LAYWLSATVMNNLSQNDPKKEKVQDFIRNGRLDAAMVALKDLCKENPSDDGTWLMLGDVYGQQGKLSDACSCFQEAVNVRAENDQAQFMLGFTFQQLGKHAEAVNAYQAAISINPDNADARHNLKSALLLLNGYEEVLSDTILEQTMQCLMWHIHPEWGDRNSLDVINRLLAKKLRPEGWETNMHLDIGPHQVHSRQEQWTIDKLEKLSRDHSSRGGDDFGCPIIIIEYESKQYLLDGNHRVNRWIKTRDPNPHDINIHTISGGGQFTVLPAIQATNMKPAKPPTGKTILSGTTPHEMTGEVSDTLRKYMALPDSGWTEIQLAEDFSKDVVVKANMTNVFSVLTIHNSMDLAMADRVVESQRADAVRPGKMHVSQSVWDIDSEQYALDEWVTVGADYFLNVGAWGKLEDQETRDQMSNINESLLPVTLLNAFLESKIEHAGLLYFEGNTYIFFEAMTRKQQEKELREQVWVDKNSLFIRKHSHALYQNNDLVSEKVAVFVEHNTELSISAPEWLNFDSDNKIINSSVCVIEHW